MTRGTRQSDLPATARKRSWHIAGQVQGVGFRPFIYRLARSLQLVGSVRNSTSGVVVEAWGTTDQLNAFASRVLDEAPALAQVETLQCIEDAVSTVGEDSFRIIQSTPNHEDRGRVTVDAAVCTDCLTEMFDAGDRRSRHALINCTNCGPRYTIVRDLPYDRPLTTMSSFAMCGTCRREYEDPTNRRFHAQPTCCPDCGPQVRLVMAGGRVIENDPVAAAASMLCDGGLLAMKGTGGYHLVADASNDTAVRRLRSGKRRDYKPFAIMVDSLASARKYAMLSAQAEALLESPISPIVLACRRDAGNPDSTGPGAEERIPAESVAMTCHRLGLMLPNTPMQHLLAAEPVLEDRPLVMTSANYSDDPLISDDQDALEGLGAICDALLVHDRPIERAVDDSVVADTSRGLVTIRRARGYVPAPLHLPVGATTPGLCVGAELKNTVALVRGNELMLSQHLGDLTYALAYQRFERTINDLMRLFDSQPRWIACDKHPHILSSQYAREFAHRREIPLVAIQHHHAHLASLMVEHGRVEPIVCIVCDGVGHGDDGTSWGGEVLVGDLTQYCRTARLRPLRLPGGDTAAREIGRCAMSWLRDGSGDEALLTAHAERVLPDTTQRDAVVTMLDRDLNCPVSSGMGRLFDAAAALLGVCAFNHHEAMSGMTLEAAAERAPSKPPGDGLIALRTVTQSSGAPLMELDHRPLLHHLLAGLERGEEVEDLAWQFHDALAASTSDAAARAAATAGINTIGLTGGVFCNALLTDLVAGRLEVAGFHVLVHHAIPPNDGGIACGQAAIAAAQTCPAAPGGSTERD